jgi:hypothetical protein
MKQPITVTILRFPEPLYRSGWKFVAYREEQTPVGLGQELGMKLIPMYLAAETVKELTERIEQSEQVISYWYAFNRA